MSSVTSVIKNTKQPWGGEEGLLKQQRYDEIKIKYCKEHSIPLIIINFSKNRKINKNEVIKEDLLVNN